MRDTRANKISRQPTIKRNKFAPVYARARSKTREKELLIFCRAHVYLHHQHPREKKPRAEKNIKSSMPREFSANKSVQARAEVDLKSVGRKNNGSFLSRGFVREIA